MCKVFRKHLDRSPTEFINELRINHAARLLADSGESIAELAYRLNFQSLSRLFVFSSFAFSAFSWFCF